MPSVVSEQEAYLLSAVGRRRFSSHVSSASSPQAEVGMLPSQRVASVQSEPGQQNLLIQQPLGRKRGLRQLRRPLLSRQKTQTEPKNRHGARLSTTRRSIQPKTKPSADQKRSVTFIEAQPEPGGAPTDALPATVQPQGCSPALSRKPEGMDKPVLTSSPAIVAADLHSLSPKQGRALEKQSETLSAEEGEKKEDPEVPGAAAHSPLSTQISDPDDFTGLETSILLQHGDTVLHISEENGMENPLLSSQYTLTPAELGEIRVDLDESHV
ncbi:unc-80-like protein, NALCN channel complex subunit [Phyllostomus discolor]|nr:unc-80-like protein, NALCN channel complex subunit [Phyllostomus discolor]